MTGVRRRGRLIAVGAAVAVVGLLAIAQLTLPSLAADKIHDEVARYGTVRSVHVSAFPAVELLWGEGQSATVTAGKLTMTFSQVAKLMHSAEGFADLDITTPTLGFGPMTISPAGIHKRGDDATIEGEVGLSSLKAFLPEGIGFRVLGTRGVGVLILLHGGLLGPRPLPAELAIDDGRLVVEPRGATVLPTITVFADPRLRLERFQMSPDGPGRYHLRITGAPA